MKSDLDLYSIKQAFDLESKDVKKLYREHSNIKLPDIYYKFSFGKKIFSSAKGSFIYDKQKNKYFDFTGGLGVANFGHNHPKIIKARINFQKNNYLEIHKSYLNRYLAAASSNLSKILGNNLEYVFFCNSGAEANDGALKISYKYFNGKRKIVLCSDRSFHGRTIGSGSISSGDNFVAGNYRFSFQKIPGVIKYKFNDIKNLKKVINKYKSNIYGIFIEPFSCSTLTETKKEFLIEANKLCKKYNILMIYDEIYSGFGKCGYDFYFKKYKVTPDIISLSKSLGGGKSSISAYVASKKVFSKSYGSLSGSLLHSTTYNSLAEECATVIETTNIMNDKKLIRNTKILDDLIKKKLHNLKAKYPNIISEIRGSGCHYGIIFKKKFNFLKEILKLIPISFIQDPLFLDKIIVTSIMEEYFSKKNVISSFTSNIDVILNISPPINSDKKIVENKIDDFEDILKIGLEKIVLKFIKKNLI
jgi:putrescine aminotransferase